MDTELFHSCHDVSEGGLLITVMESAISGGIGCQLNIPESKRADEVLFSEAASRAVVTVEAEKIGAFIQLAKVFGLQTHALGTVGGENIIVQGKNIPAVTISLQEATEVWYHTISDWMKK